MDGEMVAVGSLWPSLLLSSVGGKNSVHWEVPTFFILHPNKAVLLPIFVPLSPANCSGTQISGEPRVSRLPVDRRSRKY
jgi:hypothetical protein